MALRLVVISTVALNALLWSQSHYYSTNSGLSKRSFVEQCAPITVPVDLQCTHVTDSCPAPETFLSVDYLKEYYCTTPPLRPLRFTGLILWLVFLFSFIGITASDFFCPNLATIAHLFGLSENVAGVTFLAFGNGSPDLFSTYSAMRANSGSLAIGELLGAATFIVSVVVGSMCIIKPFHVRKPQFLRDVGFFTVAVAMLLAILIDGKIMRWEAASLVGLYVAYVIFVIVGTWWENRKARLRLKEQLIRAEYADDNSIQIVRATRLDFPSSPSHLDASDPYDAAAYTPTAYADDEDQINEPYTNREPDSHQQQRESSRSRVQAIPLMPRRPAANRILPAFFNNTGDEGQIFLPPSPPSPRLRTQSSPTLPSHQPRRPVVDTTLLDLHGRLTQSQVVAPSQEGRLSTSSSVVNLSASHQPNSNTPRLPHTQSHRHRRHSHHRPHSPTQMPSFSLLGALEFRSVISALQQESTSGGLDLFTQPSPSTPYAANYYRTHHRHSVASSGRGARDEEEGLGRSGSGEYDEEMNPWDEPFTAPLDQQSDQPSHLAIDTSGAKRKGKSPIPSISIHSPAIARGGAHRSSGPPSPSTSVIARHHVGTGIPATTSAPAELDTLTSDWNTRDQHSVYSSGLSPTAVTSVERTPLPNIPLSLHSPLEASASSFHFKPPSASSSCHIHRRTRWQKFKAFLLAAGRTLFPTLRNLASKTWMGRLVSVLAAPAVLCLTLTLPVVITREESEDECDLTDDGGEDIKSRLGRPPVIAEVDEEDEEAVSARAKKEAKLNGIATGVNGGAREGTLIDLGFGTGEAFSPSAPAASDTVPTIPRDDSRSLSSSEAEDEAESDVSSIVHTYQEELHGGDVTIDGGLLGFNKWLIMTQCTLGPLFAAAVLFAQSPKGWIYLVSASAVGVSGACLVLVFADNGKNTAGRIGRCLMGFIIAMVWIMAIADEVVTVLQTFGFIFGLSDAIIGLTVFAIGNSLADFVANLSVAVFAPIMGFSACFGGPMLNILLGVGVSGSIVLSSSSTLDYYDIEFSTTLLVSSVGLLVLLIGTLVVVPLNGFWLSKAWGYTLIVCYVCIMVVNVVVEVKREQ